MRRTAGGVLCKDDRLLLAQRSHDRPYYPGVWDIIGWHARHSENPEDTLRRELREELGIVPVCFRKIGVFAEPHPQKYGEGEHHVFVVTEWIGDPHNLRPDEHERIAWFSSRELQELDLASPEYVRILGTLCHPQ
jgi:8-oxo-dGTP diphosphatase